MEGEQRAGKIWQLVEKSFGLKTPPGAGRARDVGTVAGEKHADVHFVSLAFEPAKVAFDTLPGAGPFELGA